MLNGPITHVMLETGSAIYDNVVEASNADRSVLAAVEKRLKHCLLNSGILAANCPRRL